MQNNETITVNLSHTISNETMRTLSVWATLLNELALQYNTKSRASV